MGASTEQMEQWLLQTTSADHALRSIATECLQNAEEMPGFAACLLAICSTADQKKAAKKLAAATYLKNYIKKHWTAEDMLPEHDRKQLREQLVEVLLRSDSSVVNQLTEAFRIVASHDFSGKEATWEELVPALKAAAQNSDLLSTQSNAQYKTYNVLLAIQAITKPFQYFLDPTVAREPVPPLLELISKELLVPLHNWFHIQAQSPNWEHDNSLLVITKTFHLAIGAHMTPSLLSCLSNWVEDILMLLDGVVVDEKIEHSPRLKIWKRCLQICTTLVTRHRKQVDKSLELICDKVLKIAKQSTVQKDIDVLQERIISLAFDSLSNILETGHGWRILAPQFSSLLKQVIFPSLVMKQKDIAEWNEDEDEYVRKNLPSDLDESAALRDDLLTPRRSALNFLGIMAVSKGPPTIRAPKNSSKRKKGEGKDIRGTAGELLVMPFFSRHPLPTDGAFFESTVSYYGVLLAYGALQEFLKSQTPEYVQMILSTRVFPLYSMPSASPYLLANANWLLGELASCLPETLNHMVYECLLKALVAPDVGGISWRPVRASAAAAIAALLEEDYKPGKWFPLFQAIVVCVKAGPEEAGHALQLLTTAAETGEEAVAVHVPYLISSIKDEISKHIPPLPEPWPQVVELGFGAIAALAHSWDSAEPDSKKKGREPFEQWKQGCMQLRNTYAHLLQRAWFTSNEDGKVCPPPSCLTDVSVILGCLVKYTSEASDIQEFQIERLLQTWVDLIADWNAWDEEEDMPVFDTIEEVIALNGRCPLQQFIVPAKAGARSILEGMAGFVSLAMDTAYAAATWRACRLSHSFLHSTAVSFDGENSTKILARQFTEAAIGRLNELSSPTVPLAKPLLLVIASCYVTNADEVAFVLDKEDFMQWVNGFLTLVGPDADPGLSLESELKLAVMCMLKLVERLTNDVSTEMVALKCLQSAVDCSIRLKELDETQKDGGDTDEDEDGDEDSSNDTEDESEDEEDEEEDEREETEDEFLERYAETAREIEEEAEEDIEGGADEDGHELELGVLALADTEKQLLSCVQTYRHLLVGHAFSDEVFSKFPELRCFSKSQLI